MTKFDCDLKGRNVPLNATTRDDCNLFKPNPRDISRELLERKQFIPVKSINILIAGWIQFMIHDWFYSGANDNRRYLSIPLKYFRQSHFVRKK